jgi:hypothetical protein
MITSIHLRNISRWAGPLLVWFLLIQPRWIDGGSAPPMSQWENYGGFDTREICESNRSKYIAQENADSQGRLRDGSACVSGQTSHRRGRSPHN